MWCLKLAARLLVLLPFVLSLTAGAQNQLDELRLPSDHLLSEKGVTRPARTIVTELQINDGVRTWFMTETFNKHGLLVERRWNQRGVELKSTYVYDNSNRPTTVTTYSGDMELFKVESEYDELGLVRETVYPRDGTVLRGMQRADVFDGVAPTYRGFRTFTLDEQGRIATMDWYIDGKLDTVHEIIYDDLGRISEIRMPSLRTDHVMTYQYEYGDLGDVTLQRHLDSTGWEGVPTTFTYVYDEHGSWVEKRSEYLPAGFSRGRLQVFYRTITYY